MKKYQAIRISSQGRATYGDKYVTVISEKDYQHNEIIENNGNKYIILFREE